jgi:hypothetical protein
VQLKWTGPIAILVFSFLQPCKLAGLKFVPIYEALTIRANKSSPPHIAFEESLRSQNLNDEWSNFSMVPTTQLASGLAQVTILRKDKLPRVVLSELRISREPSSLTQMVAQKSLPHPQSHIQSYATEVDRSWMEELSEPQQKILKLAQERTDVLDQDWSQPTWSEEVRRVLEQSGVKVAGRDQNIALPPTSSAPPKYTVQIPADPTDSNSTNKSSTIAALSQSSVGFVSPTDGNKTISGPIEITGGLAVTNDHYIEVRRSAEGVAQEVGRVDLHKGTYQINVRESSGVIIARLVTKSGQILGEGSIRLSHLDTNQSQVVGPKLKIEPSTAVAGIVVSAYGKPGAPPPKDTVVTMLRGARDIEVKKDGLIAMDKIAKGSSTVVRAAAPTYMQSASLVVAGDNYQATLFPESMIRALREIILNEKQDQTAVEDMGNVVWGKVSLDGHPMSGIEVKLESLPEMEAVYFNQFMIPDSNLKSTGENGLYAFISVTDGFHSLVATRENGIFGYQNVVVEKGSVAIGDIQNSIHVDSVPLRVFDAFSGAPLSADVTLQSLDHELNVHGGADVLLLPQVNRVGLLRVRPESNDYLAARYLYNDKDSFVHLPMIAWSWLSSIKTFFKLSEVSDSGIVVGFVPDEDFEAYVAGDENFPASNIVYFDMQGRILQTGKGAQGGGFIIYNLPADIHEIVVLGSRTEKIFSKVLPIDPNSLSVLSFRE